MILFDAMPILPLRPWLAQRRRRVNCHVRGDIHSLLTCRLHAVCTTYHVLGSLELPTVALHLIECTFQHGFESHSLSATYYSVIFRYNFGTTEREKNGALLPKRHQMKHLEFVLR